jgi:transposase
VREEAYMTKKEVFRAEIFVRIAQGHISKTQAAHELNISLRHVLRLNKEYGRIGREALLSKRRGKPSNHQLPNKVTERVIDLVAREAYAGFRPTFMCEKLFELHRIKLSKETVRRLMIQAGVWSAKSKKRPVVHQQRTRRARYGELVQIDGSPHDWFEGRGERCSLLVYIDDATGRTYGKFAPTESSEAYMDTTREYIKKIGMPRCFYSDKHGIFRINRPGYTKEMALTQFGRALKELNIELICANSPQAKGRVERANLTLQDRLVKDMRLAHVTNIEEANQFLEKSAYWARFNKKFARQPVSKENAHRSMPLGCNLEEVLCFKETRVVTKNLELQYDNVLYQILPEDWSRGLCGARVSIIKKLDGSIFIEYKGRKIRFREYGKQICAGPEIDSKQIDRFLREKLPRVVPANHPWKRRRDYLTKLAS